MRARIGAFGVVVLLLTAFVAAQTGQIVGVVRDASGAALPGVTVEATSPALIEKSRLTTTDANGRYRITSLPVGQYSVTFRLQGFSTVRREGIALTADFHGERQRRDEGWGDQGDGHGGGRGASR